MPCVGGLRRVVAVPRPIHAVFHLEPWNSGPPVSFRAAHTLHLPRHNVPQATIVNPFVSARAAPAPVMPWPLRPQNSIIPNFRTAGNLS